MQFGLIFLLKGLSAMSATKEIPIPGPRGVPILGNIYDIEPEVPLNSIDLLADNYGEFHNATGKHIIIHP